MKKFLSLLAACMLLSSTVLAANETHPFVRTKTYENQFSDLSADSGFYANVSALYEYGLSVGKSDGTFGMKDPTTVGQGIIFAGRLRSLYETGDAEAGAAAFRADGQEKYQPYLLYLQSLGVLGSELDGTYFSPATRAVTAHVLANALPAEFFPDINHDVVTQGYATHRFIPDVDEYTPYYQDILSLYRRGISQGSDAAGTFRPHDTITRGALAAMLTRMVDPALRITLDWQTYSAMGTRWSDLISGGTPVAAPATAEEFDACIRHMLAQDSLALQLDYGRAVNEDFVRSVLQQCLAATGRYAEQMLSHAACTYYPSNGKITVTFSVAGSDPEQTAAYRTETLSAAIAVHDHLWDSGALTPQMTQLERARVLFNWICENCSYDYSTAEDPLRHTAWSLFLRGSAVCDGYTGAYNLLLKLEGIDCRALSNGDHAWTVAVLDGAEYHIDATWGDASGYHTDYSCFAMTEAQSYALHPW